MTPASPPTPDDKLLPCPFCGGEPIIKSHRWANDTVKAHYVHCQKCNVNSHGRNTVAKTVAFWNTRAALRPPEPSPPELEVARDVSMALVDKARTLDLSDQAVFDKWAMDMARAGDDEAHAYYLHRTKLLADMNAKYPQPSPDDAAVLDEHADALAEWKHIESEYAETSPNYVAAKARFEQARAAVLARMSKPEVGADDEALSTNVVRTAQNVQDYESRALSVPPNYVAEHRHATEALRRRIAELRTTEDDYVRVVREKAEMWTKLQTAESALAACRDKTITECGQQCVPRDGEEWSRDGLKTGNLILERIRALKSESKENGNG